jgi:hypothetical protein
MAQEIVFGRGGEGKIRSFWVGFGLTAVTFSIYGFCWYYFVNNELKDVGLDKKDDNLGQSSPAMSVTALVLGGFTFWVAPLLSIYNYGQRIKRSQRLVGIPREDQIDPTISFLLYFPGALLIIPFFFHYWYVTKHQNMVMRAAGGLPYKGEVTSLGAGEAQIGVPGTQPLAAPSVEPPMTSPPPPPAAQ